MKIAIGWISISSKIEKCKDRASLGRIVSKNRGVVLGTLKLPDGSYLTSERKTLRHLIETYFLGFDDARGGGWIVQKQ